MNKRLILHWVDQEVGATKAFCGQQGGVLLTHLKEAATCSNCVKKLTFLKRVRERYAKPLVIPLYERLKYDISKAQMNFVHKVWLKQIASNLVSIESHKKGD